MIKDPKNLKSPSFTWREFKHKQLLCSFSPETLLKPTSGTLLDNQRINRTLARVVASGTCLSLRDSPSMMIIGCYLPCPGLFGFIKQKQNCRHARRQHKANGPPEESSTRVAGDCSEVKTWTNISSEMRISNQKWYILGNWDICLSMWPSKSFWYPLSWEDHQNEDINTHNGTKAQQAW